MELEKLPENFMRVVRPLFTDKPDRRMAILVTQVDPDAIGAAVAMQALYRDAFSKDTIIYYCGGFGHPQNRCVANLFGLSGIMKPIAEFDVEQILFTDITLVDSSSVSDARLGVLKDKIDPVVVIDHHETDLRSTEGKFVWIEQVGSASSMVARLCHELEYTFDVKDGPMVAKLLALGIYNDTKALVGARDFDREAYAIVTGYFPAEEMAELIDYPLPKSHFDNLKAALLDMQRVENVIVAGCGNIPLDQGDDLSSIADYLIRMTGVTQVFVWAIVNNRVRISARNTDLSIDFHQYLRERFGHGAGSKLGIGGRSEGGALITLELDFWSEEGTQQEVVALVRKKLGLLLLPAVK